MPVIRVFAIAIPKIPLCISLKILFSNVCIFDCAYCVSRRSNDVQRAAFTVQEVVDLTINFTVVIILKVYF